MDLQPSENGVHGVSYNGSEVQLNTATLIAEPKTEKEKKRRFLCTRVFENYSCNQLLTFCVLALADFFCYCCMSMLAPFFPNEAHKKGMSEFGSGLVFAFYALVMFVTSPIFGKFVRYSGEKLMFILGITLAGACNILFGSLKNVDNLMVFTFLCFLIRGLEALGSSAYATASFIYVINIFPNNIGKVCGILETIVGVGMSLGPVIGGALFSYGGFPLPFYTIGFLTLLVAPISFWLLPPSDSRRNIDGSFLELLRIKEVFATIIVIIAVSINWSFLDPILEPYLRQFDMSTNNIAFLFLLLTITYAVFCPIWGWISDNKKLHWALMTTGFFFSFISLLVIGPISSYFTPENPFTLLVVGLGSLGVSIALALLPTFDGIFIHANSSENGSTVTQGIVSGLWSSAYSLGQMIGPSFGGGAAEHYGFSTTTSIVAGLNFLTFLMTSVFLYKDLKRNRAHPGSARTDVAQTQSETITNVNTTEV